MRAGGGRFLSDRPYRREDHQPAAAEDAGKEPARSRGRKVAYTRQGCLRRRSAALPIGRRAVEAGQEADEVMHGGRHQPERKSTSLNSKSLMTIPYAVL